MQPSIQPRPGARVQTPVPTRSETVTDVHHGVEVTEQHRWLEGSDEETRAWTDAQAAAARAYLDAVPGRDRIARRFDEILRVETARYDIVRAAGDAFVACKSQPPRQQPFLVVIDDLDRPERERVLVDPNLLDETGHTTIDFFEVSPDGGLVAVSLSENGTEVGTVHVFRVADGARVGEPLSFVNSGVAGGSLAWRGDGGGFWCTHHAAPEETGAEEFGFHQDVAFHDLGAGRTTVELTGVFADNRIAESFLSSSRDGGWVMDRVQRGDGNEWEIFARRQDGGDWTRVAELADEYVDARFGTDGDLFLLCTKGTPRGRVLRMRLPDGRPEVVLPQGELAVEQVVPTAGGLWVSYLDGGPSALRRFTLDGEPMADVALPEVCAVDGLARLGPDRVVWSVETFTSPRSWWTCTDDDVQPRRTGLDTRTPHDLSSYRVRRVLATSADGTRVPVTLIAAPDTPPGAPTILYGYGGYGISLKPSFSPDRLFWLEQGGVHAVANIRGGGEYGVEWHHGGRLRTKQNCFDDFAACADHLVGSGVTTRDRLAIMGGSNGGLLVGAVLTQRPDIARAAVAMVPVMDAIRSETTPNGQFNTTEFGTVEDEDEFRALLAYSPYHHVVDGTAYPAVLLTAGELDPRVEAWHAKKMAARLQSATSSGEPVLLRMEHGGHGIGQSLDQLVGERTDVYAFLVDRLGVDLARPAG